MKAQIIVFFVPAQPSWLRFVSFVSASPSRLPWQPFVCFVIQREARFAVASALQAPVRQAAGLEHRDL